ncbi:MAG: hypothetical protein ACI9WS_003271 [Paraglaciecola psychrophila]|jgi:hypothetical protein
MIIDGNWNVVLKSPMSSQQMVLLLDSSNGVLSGAISGVQGVQGVQAFTGGTIEGNTVQWDVKMLEPVPMTLEFTAVVGGDTIGGEIKLGAFGSATFTGSRA